MKKSAIVIAAIAVMFSVSLIIAGSSFAQPAKDAYGWSIGIPASEGTEFTSQAPAIETVEGTVTKIEKMQGVKDGLQMRLKTKLGETWTVYMGPKWFIENQRIKFMPKDKVEVRGAKIVSKGQVRLVATEISKGDWTMKLRNEDDGSPNWVCCVPRQKMQEE